MVTTKKNTCSRQRERNQSIPQSMSSNHKREQKEERNRETAKEPENS